MFGRTAVLALAAGLTSCATTPPPETAATMQQWAEVCEPWDEWDKPAPPYRVHGNTWYVGTCGIAAILVVGGEEHILIDTGTGKGAQVVLENIRKIGAYTRDIRFITHSHEHFDHIGGLNEIYMMARASVVTSYPAESVISTGEADPADPQYGMHDPMEPVSVQLRVANGEEIQTLKQGQLDVTLTAIETPGHTPGALSWQWESCEGNDCKTIVYADSLSPVSRDDYRFSDHPEYVAEFRAGLARLAALDCDILLTPHPSASDMLKRAATGTLEGGLSCKQYATRVSQRLDARLAKEAAAE